MYRIHIQNAAKEKAPSATLIRSWARHALRKKIQSAEVTIRMVDLNEMTELNEQFRNKKGPTNVLSFPFILPAEIPMRVPLIGDIAICSAVVNREAEEQEKQVFAHWAHMVVHGIFHLLGYDHQTDSEAKVMEDLEIETLQALGFPNPYKDNLL